VSDVLQKALLAQLRRTNENEAMIKNTQEDFKFIEATMTEHRTAAGFRMTMMIGFYDYSDKAAAVQA
jgi:hypothetical protein